MEFRDAGNPVSAVCLAVDRDHDVAVLKVDRLPAGTRVLELAWKATPKQGDAVWTIGHPNQLKNTVSWGDVNAVRRTSDLPVEVTSFLHLADSGEWAQTDSVIDQGSSGGPLLNSHGQVIGMNTFIVGAQQGFALLVRHTRHAIDTAKSGKPLKLPLPPGNGEPAFAWPSREVGPIVREFAEQAQKLEESGLSHEQIQR